MSTELFQHFLLGVPTPMYFRGLFHKRNLFYCLTLPIRHFASYSCIVNNRVSLYLQQARLVDSIRVTLRSKPPRSLIPLLNDPVLDSFVVSNALRSAPSLDSALSLVETLKTVPNFSHTQNTLYTLAKILAKSRRTTELRNLIDAINSGNFTNVARVSFMDRMRWFAAAGDLDEVLYTWDEWRALKRHLCTESYNIVMGVYAQMGRNAEAVKTFYRMIDEGALPNSRTYTVMIEHLVGLGKLGSALDIFGTLPFMRMKRTLRQYSLLVGAFTSTERFDVVKTLLNEMQTDRILPGTAMLWALQHMQEAGFLEEKNELVQEMLPDERIKKVRFPMDDDGGDDDGDADEDEHEYEDADSAYGDVHADRVQLKPWLDPAALASALHYWRPKEVLALEDAKFVWTTRLVCKLIRNFTSAETTWQFFCWVAYQPGFTHDVYTVSRTIAKLARHGRIDVVDQLICKIKREGIKLSFSTVRLIIDFYGISGNGGAALNVFRDAKMLCGPITKSSLLLLYSSLLRTLAKCKMNSVALDILDEMILCGILPDIQTFSGLMHHFALRGDIKMVQRIFGMVRQSGVEPDAYMFKVLIRAYCKCDRAALALRIFEDMRNSNLKPDAATKQLLVKSLWKTGRLREAAAVEERSEDINVLPLALPGHVYTVSSADLTRVYNIYSSTFTVTDG